jgi:GMP synthase-like glutamine amidotransferase
MMRMAVLQHVEFEGPAAVADWAAGRGFPLRVFHLYRDTTLPSLSDFDMLTVMGGPMSANDEARLGWLGPEIALVREAIAADKIVLGICLGAQIIAKALGARVYPGGTKEIGWFPVQRTGSHSLFDGLPDSFTTFHWHGETFDLPHEATSLAKSKITETQAFAVGQRVLGLQFTWRQPRKVCARSLKVRATKSVLEFSSSCLTRLSPASTNARIFVPYWTPCSAA